MDPVFVTVHSKNFVIL